VAARLDVRHGRYKLLVYGLPPAWRPEYKQLLKQRYGIEMNAVASCTPSGPLRSYVAAYDEVSTIAANRKYGHDVFRECAEDAEKIWAREQVVGNADQQRTE